jgi:hypothetical protein
MGLVHAATWCAVLSDLVASSQSFLLPAYVSSTPPERMEPAREAAVNLCANPSVECIDCGLERPVCALGLSSV